MVDISKRFMSQYPIWGIDVSKYQDRPGTSKKPTLQRIADLGGSIVGIKIAQGTAADPMGSIFWNEADEINQKAGKLVLARLPYPFPDYYNYIKGNEAKWAIEQARFAWNLIRHNPGELPGHLDIETVPWWFVLNALTASRPFRIFNYYMQEWDQLSGSRMDAYSAPGYLPLFGDGFKDRDLWLAWYNEYRKWADIEALLAKFHWRGKAWLWQYNSDGDLDENGTPDGIELGMEEAKLDMNVSRLTVAEFSRKCGMAPVPVTPPTEDPVSPVVITATGSRTVPVMTVDCTSGLNVRSAMQTGVDNVLTWLTDKKSVDILETIQSGQDVWARVGIKQYAAIRNKGINYLK